MNNPIVIKEGTEECVLDGSVVNFIYSPHLNKEDQWVVSVLVDQRFIDIVFENEDYAVTAYNMIKQSVTPQYISTSWTSDLNMTDHYNGNVTIGDPPPDWDGTVNWQYVAEHYKPDVPGAGYNTVGFAPYKTN